MKAAKFVPYVPVSLVEIKVGDLVLRVTPKELSKFHGHAGPFVVIQELGSSSFRIKSLIFEPLLFMLINFPYLCQRI